MVDVRQREREEAREGEGRGRTKKGNVRVYSALHMAQICDMQGTFEGLINNEKGREKALM